MGVKVAQFNVYLFLTGVEKICVQYRTIWIYATLYEKYNFLNF